MIRELSRAIELSGREGGRDLEAEGIWEELGCEEESHRPFAHLDITSCLVLSRSGVSNAV